MSRIIRAPRGSEISCKGWQQEAAMRMLMNNLDPDVAELPDQLIIYGGNGKAARNWECYDAIIASLKELENDETLMVQSGKPVGVFKTHADAPRVMIANSNLVGNWANWDYFRKLDALGLIMYGQMTAGSWIYIGTQGILQGTYETFAEAAERHFGGTLAGRLVLTAGLGGMGGAQPLAATMCDGVCIAVDVDKYRIDRRLKDEYLDKAVDTIDEALALAKEAMSKKEPLSIAIHSNAADIIPEFAKRGIVPDLLTDQTSAHDELNGYVPNGISYEEALKLRTTDPKDYKKRSMDAMGLHVQGMLDLQKAGAVTFDYGNNIREMARINGVTKAYDIPGFVPEYIRPLFCEGLGPFRWAALSGDPADIYATDEAVLKEFPEKKSLHRWIKKVQTSFKFQGLPSRICWLGYGERDRMGVIFNNMVRDGRLKAPVVIGRDHLDSGSVASPYRETEGMKDGSDAIADWPILNAMLNVAGGATWVSYHHGGGVGIGYSLHAGFVILCDGTDEAEARIKRVLLNDPGTGVMRHADAGYEKAQRIAKERGVKIPMMK